jgi:hypothetical protein
MSHKEAKASAELSSDVECAPCVIIELGEWSRAGGWRSDEWCAMSAVKARELARDLENAARRVEEREI